MLTCEERFKRFEHIYGNANHMNDKTFETAKDNMHRKPYQYSNTVSRKKVSIKKKG